MSTRFPTQPSSRATETENEDSDRMGGLSFANPLGFLALLGVPLLLLIHLLQRRSRPVVVSTLFLVERSFFETERGTKVERLRWTPALWLQLAAVLLLTWVLVAPRWIRDDSTERVVIVVDGSASMMSFRPALEQALASELARIEQAAASTEWIVLGSDPRERTLYSGSDRASALEAATSWTSRLGSHDMSRVLGIAGGIAGTHGQVILATDHDVEVQEYVAVLAVGVPTDNVGLVSAEVDPEGTWRAIVQSSSGTPQERRWWVEVPGDDGAASPGTEPALALEPGELRFLSGRFPEGQARLELVMESDGFPIDDRLPLLRPRPKPLVLFSSYDDAAGFTEKLVAALTPAERTAEPNAADIAIVRGADVPGALTGPDAIVFAPDSETRTFLRGDLVVTNDPLVEGLDFRGLLVRASAPFERREGDQVLLWQGERALLSIRRSEGRELLLVNFAMAGSNADRVPSFVLVVTRFAEAVRARKRALEERNVETRQRISVPAASGRGEVTMVPAVDSSAGATADGGMRAPDQPGFFELQQGGETLFRGAAHFADAREGDLTNATSRRLSDTHQDETVFRNSRPDPFSALWLVMIMALLVSAWALSESRA